MRFFGNLALCAAVALGAVTLQTGSAAAQDKSARAVQVCSKASLRKNLYVQSVILQQDARTQAGRLLSSRIQMEARTGSGLGSGLVRVDCVYTANTDVADIRIVRDTSNGNQGGGNQPRESETACLRAVEAQSMRVDRIVGEKDIRKANGKTVGRKIQINVHRNGRPRLAVCSFDFSSRNTSIEVRDR